MANLPEIRAALIKTIQENVDPELNLWGYEYLEEVTQLPCIIAEPDAGHFDGAMQNGLHTYPFRLYVLVSRNTGAGFGQQILDQLVGGYGPNSINEILREHSDLDMVEECDAHCVGFEQYGGALDMAGIAHIGAIMLITVRVRGY